MGVLSKINRARKKATSAITKPFVKAVSKISDKLIPNELRFLAPYAAGIGTLMLPPGMGPLMRGLAGAGFNTLGQIASDETPVEDISDLNALSIALAGGLGALGSNKITDPKTGIRSGIDGGEQFAMQGADAGQYIGSGQDLPGTTGFLQGAENVGREGIASLSDYVQGGRQTLAGLGSNPEKLMSLGGVKDAASALAPALSQGSGDVAYEAAVDLKNEQDALDAEEAAEYGANEEARRLERYNAIRAGMEENNFTDEEIQVVFDRLGLGEYVPSQAAAQGGIIGLKEGGMLNFGGREMDLRTGGFVPIGKKERADDVPARLSKNEFVMTADAVRAAGGGSVNKGAQRMYDVMNKLEARA
ncbi:hypothetical protein N9T00_00505 [bacterium]|nr:hypothetical protein [bacterium]